MSQKKTLNNQDYFKQGETWEQSIYANMKSSRNRAWLVAFFSMSIALSSVLCIALLLPLKTYEPYVVTIDNATGYTEITRTLKEGAISQDEAITQSNLVRYVSMRESYNPHILKENYKKIALLSDKKALKEFEELWSADNKDNPSKKYGRKSTIDTKIKSVSFLNENTAQVRFLTHLRKDNVIRAAHWNAIITFRYTQKPMKMIERFVNPLGFQVISYRKSQEILEE
ncbi:MAG: type VI secretion protein [Alphaproteobacteria bacterium]|nr:MAG: type VI secretion protein [Alphaproteobacteria bacterium]